LAGWSDTELSLILPTPSPNSRPRAAEVQRKTWERAVFEITMWKFAVNDEESAANLQFDTSGFAST
jgi:hypothetical protein